MEPLKYIISSDTNMATFATTLLNHILLLPTCESTPILRIGLTPEGDELMPDTLIDKFTKIVTNIYFSTDSLIYVTVINPGTAILIKNTTFNPFEL